MMNDITDDEGLGLVGTLANALRQHRQGRPIDAWDIRGCTQADVDAARSLAAIIRTHRPTADDHVF